MQQTATLWKLSQRKSRSIIKVEPKDLGKKYDKIAAWWNDYHLNSKCGLDALERAISYTSKKGLALDVGCGSGGRMINTMTSNGFHVTGIDVSTEMIMIAKRQHPDCTFVVADITDWETDSRFDLILAWDSIFHLPIALQEPVLRKLSRLLSPEGVLLYTFGNAAGEHETEWHNDLFHYSSIGINENLKAMISSGCECLHLELDQYPERHVVMIARKLHEPK